MSKIVVVGGGAAGLLCAAKSAEKGNDVIIIEKMNRCGRKLMITGKGRCNVTNASFELDDLISNVPTNPRFLYSAFSNFMPYDTMALFEELGVALKIERGNRVFPVSDKAVDIVLETGTASTSFLQRKLSVGYARGAKIIDQLEEKGIIGPANGSKGREILINRQQWLEMQAYSSNKVPFTSENTEQMSFDEDEIEDDGVVSENYNDIDE